MPKIKKHLKSYLYLTSWRVWILTNHKSFVPCNHNLIIQESVLNKIKWCDACGEKINQNTLKT